MSKKRVVLVRACNGVMALYLDGCRFATCKASEEEVARLMNMSAQMAKAMNTQQWYLEIVAPENPDWGWEDLHNEILAYMDYRDIYLPVTGVAHWDHYGNGTVKPSHLAAIEDRRDTAGQASIIVLTPSTGNQYLSVTMEVSETPGGLEVAPVAHVHFDGDHLALSLFRVEEGILLCPEVGVTLEKRGDAYMVSKEED